MHLVIYFCGTGDSGETFTDNRAYLNNTDIRTVFVEGCHKPQVCDSIFFPNLKEFAGRFSRAIFKKEGDNEEQVLVVNPNELGLVGVNYEHTSTDLSDIDRDDPIESITLCGYSRGAVTCFEVARELNKIAPDIPVDIVADQPVPGNSYQGPGTNAGSIADCSDLKNLRNVSVILGSYTGALYKYSDGKTESDVKTKKVDSVNPIHRGFFSQIVPKLPRTTQRDLIVIPRESHHQNLANSPEGPAHMHMQVAKYLNQQNLVSDKIVRQETDKARATYHQHGGYCPTLFPQKSKLQSVFGLSKKDVYRYTDKLHPTRDLREGYTFGEKEELIDWWNKHDKNASYLSTQLTKDLVRFIETVDRKTPESLIALFIEADRWLVLNADTSSSRYHQVEALRNNLYYELINEMEVPKSYLDGLNRRNLRETNYFLNHWNLVSDAASIFKTDVTHTLDQAFAAHATATPSKDNDQTLLDALDTWISNKKNSKSKRREDIIAIREHLSEVINNYSDEPSLTDENKSDQQFSLLF